MKNELLALIQNYYLASNNGQIVTDNNFTERIFKLLNKTFETLNINFNDGFQNGLKDYFQLSIDSKDDDELFKNIISLLIVFAAVQLDRDGSSFTLNKLRNLRDTFTYKSAPWERLNTLSYFLQNSTELGNTHDKTVSSAHDEKFILFRLVNESFKDKPIVVNKFSDILFIMSVSK